MTKRIPGRPVVLGPTRNAEERALAETLKRRIEAGGEGVPMEEVMAAARDALITKRQKVRILAWLEHLHDSYANNDPAQNALRDAIRGISEDAYEQDGASTRKGEGDA